MFANITAVDISDVEREVKHNASFNGINSIEVLQQDVTRLDYSMEKSFELI